MAAPSILQERQTKYRDLTEKINKTLAQPMPTEDETKQVREWLGEAQHIKQLIEMQGLASEHQMNFGGKEDKSVATERRQSEDYNFAEEAGRAKADIRYAQKGMSKKEFELWKSADYNRAMRAYCNAKGNENRLDSIDFKILQEGSDQEGGFLVPMDFDPTLIAKRPAPTTLTGRVRTIRTGRQARTLIKRNYLTDNIWTSPARVVNAGEIPPTSTSIQASTPNYAQLTIPVNTWMGSLPLSLDLWEDSDVDMQEEVTDVLADALMLQKNKSILLGSGLNDNVGIITALNGSVGNFPQLSTINIDHTVSTSFADAVRKLPYNLPPQYEDKGCFVLNKQNTGQYLSQLKDTANRYLFGYGVNDNGFASKAPTDLGGYSYIYDSFMQNATTANGNTTINTAGQIPLIFGDWSGYVLVERAAIHIRLLDQVAATQNQVLVWARGRYGGAPIEEWKMFGGVIS